MARVALPPHDVSTTLNFFKPNQDGSDPSPAYASKPETYNRDNEEHKILIKDIAGEETNFNLDKNGFQVHNEPCMEKEFLDDEKIKNSYYKEVATLLKNVTGADKVLPYDHVIRRSTPGTTRSGRDTGPVLVVHLDQTNEAAIARVRKELPEDAEELLLGRVQIINVWRPIRTVERDPLAFADAQSVDESDLVRRAFILPDFNGETYELQYNKSQKWYYRSHLTPDQVLLLKCYDSKMDGRAQRVAHSAFRDPSTIEDTPERESIEVRALVFHSNASTEI